MSKFKNKKALALSVGAIMAGVSVVGVVAACAPTKAKPSKPSQGTQNQPQNGGSESTNPGSGNTTNPSGQGSNNGGTTNPTGGSTNTSPETTPKNDSGTSGDNKDTNMPKDDKMQGDASGTDSEKTDKPKVESGDSSTETNKTEKPKEGSSTENVNKPKGETEDKNKEQDGSGSAGNQNSNSDKQQNPPAKNNVESGSDDSGKIGNGSANPSEGESSAPKGMQDPSTPPTETEGKAGSEIKNKNTQSDQTMKENKTDQDSVENIAIIKLNDNPRLIKKDNFYELTLNTKNINGKSIEVELVEVVANNGKANTIKSKEKIKVSSDNTKVLFDLKEPKLKYKVSKVIVYDDNDSVGKTIELDEKEKNKEITREIKFKGLNVINDPTNKKLMLFEITSTAANYDAVKEKVFKYELTNNDNGGYEFDVTTGANVKTKLIRKEQNGDVVFWVFPSYPWGSGNYTIERLWDVDDKTEWNLLSNKVKFIFKTA